MGRWRHRPVAGVVVALALVAGCTVRPASQPPPDSGAAAPSSVPAVTRGTTLARRAFVVEPWQGGRVRAGPTDALPVPIRRTAEEVDTVTGATSVVLVFPLLRPRGIGLLTADRAWMHFDIIELYRTWVAGGPFPSRLRTVDPRTPLVVDVRAEDFGEPTFTARVTPLGKDPDSAPQLRWTATRGC